MPDQKVLDAYYGYESYAGPNYEVNPESANAKVRMFDQFLARVESQLGRTGTLLDLGCSVGHLLEAARERGWSAVGIEVDPTTAGRTGERLHVPVYAGNAVDVIERLGSFDLIAMSHWLEHLPDPRRALDVVTPHLRPGGVLLIRVPNARSKGASALGAFWPWFSPPIHLFYFSPRSIAVMASDQHLTAAWVETARGDAQPLPFELANGLYRRLFVKIPRWTDPPPTTDRPAFRGMGSVGGKRLGIQARPIADRLFPFAGMEDTELRALLQRPMTDAIPPSAPSR
jgi:SAM-dependent methyltransferase